MPKNGVINCHFRVFKPAVFEVSDMYEKKEAGFSLTELLIVVVIIGIVAALAVPALQRGLVAAENRNVQATMRTMSSSQALFFTQNQRFARLEELNEINQYSFGTVEDGQMHRNKFTFEMTPLDPTDSELKEGYSIAAFREINGVTYRFEVTNSGVLRVLPDPEEF